MRLSLALAAMLAATPVLAEEPVTRIVEDDFDNVTFAVESAIVGHGLVIDHISHVGEMLERTRADIGSDVVLFTQADVFLFCSASVSRQAMEADPMNIQYCPYNIFVAERPDKPGQIVVGYHNYTDPSMAPVTELLAGIVDEALGPE